MRVFTIEVDEEVFAHLQAKAQAFVDTPNTVLRRELLGRQPAPAPELSAAAERRRAARSPLPPAPSLPSMPFGTPAALKQTLWVAHLVLDKGRARSEATADVARVLGVAPQTVLDKYCRQLGLTADAFDRMLREPGLHKLEALLVAKFANHADTIRGFFRAHRATA
jgi:hypothetical protein